jgi:hypothetical protein
MATNDHDQGTEVHFCYDLSFPDILPVYVSICGHRTLDPDSVTTTEGVETCWHCKQCLAKRKRLAEDYSI